MESTDRSPTARPRFLAVGFGVLAAILAIALLAPLRGAAAGDSGASNADCRPLPAGVKCQPGHGQQTAGGGASVSHKGWPKITGIRWQVIDDANRGETRGGTDYQDELLGRNGSDELSGGPSADVLWGDSSATVNGSKQHDVLDGGPGNDWIYASHGHNVITGGPGADHLTAYYGRGTIDCGPGRDKLTLGGGVHYRYRNCERVHR